MHSFASAVPVAVGLAVSDSRDPTLRRAADHTSGSAHKQTNMSSAANAAIAGRSTSEDRAVPDLAVAGCSAARWCWGSNGSGCLGVGHQNDLHTPTLCCSSGAREEAEAADQAESSRAAASASVSAASAVPAIAAPSPSGCVRFTRISCGGCHTLAIDGQTQARADGQQRTALVKGTRSQTRSLTPDAAVAAVPVTRVRAEFGLVWSWGENTWGQLGHGVAAAASDTPGTGAGPQGLACTAVLTSPRRLDFFATPSRRVRCRSVSAGWTHSACVGVDEAAATVNGDSIAVAASLAPASAAVVYSWGDNRAKQCGWGTEVEAGSEPQTTGAVISTATPPRMLGHPRVVCALRGRDVAEVHCAWKHTMARTSQGLVFVWGDNAHGQLGLGDYEARSEPTLLTDLSAAASVAAGSGGGDAAAEGALHPAPAPAPVRTPLLCADVALGWKHSLLLSLDRQRLYAAGSNVFGQLGVGSTAASEPESGEDAGERMLSPSASSSAAPPGAFASASSTLSGAAGRAASAKARRAARSALKVCRPQRVLLPLSPDADAAPDAACDTDTGGSDSDTIVAIATGWSHALALTAKNRLCGWGRADFGQLGVPPPDGTKHLPLPVELPRPAPKQHRCSRCAGTGGGGSGGSNVTPIAWDPIRRIACGSEHSLVVTRHDVWAAGWNEHGNRGLGHCEPTHLGSDKEGCGDAGREDADGAHAFGFNCVRQLHACPAEGLCHSIGTAPADAPPSAQPSTDAPALAHAAQAHGDAGAASASYSSNHLRCIRELATGGAAIIMLH